MNHDPYYEFKLAEAHQQRIRDEATLAHQLRRELPARESILIQVRKMATSAWNFLHRHLGQQPLPLLRERIEGPVEEVKG